MLNRKQLPAFGYLTNLTVDIIKLQTYLSTVGLLDFKKYDHIQIDKATNFKGFVVANQYVLNNMFKAAHEEDNNSEKFKQIQLTELDDNLSTNEVVSKPTSFFERVRRQNTKHPKYIPEAAELNYGKRSELVKGEIENIFNFFSSKITRARLNYLDAGHEIKPHVDYDTTLVCRYHIPILTDEKVKMFIQRKNIINELHLPADGKIYFFNQGLKHWVKNNSNYPRLHLIIDVHGQEEIQYMQEIKALQYEC